MDKKTCIIILPIDAMSEGRKALENIENTSYKSEEEILNALCYDENDPCDAEVVSIMELTDFMDLVNNEEFDEQGSWIGYVHIENVKTPIES